MTRVATIVLLTVLVVGAALAEPAFRRQPAQQAQQQPAQDADDAPYAPSGWKPSGQRLELPARAMAKPGQQYGAPAEDLDATTEPATEAPSSDDPDQDQQSPKRSEKQQAAPYQGQYYVILPDGRLQRVQFAARLEAPQDAPQTARTEQDDEEQADEQEQQDSPAPAPRAGPRPAPRPQSPAAPLLQGRYFVVLADGSLQEVQPAAGRLEVSETEQTQDDDEEAADKPSASRPGAGVRPQQAGVARRPQPQQRPFALLPPPGQPMMVQQQQQAGGVPSSFVAELRFMEVPPITGPVFSYSGPLVRVQRRV